MAQATSDPSLLRMVQSGGHHSDRKVTYVRIFVPVLAAQQSLDVRSCFIHAEPTDTTPVCYRVSAAAR